MDSTSDIEVGDIVFLDEEKNSIGMTFAHSKQYGVVVPALANGTRPEVVRMGTAVCVQWNNDNNISWVNKNDLRLVVKA